MKHLILIAFLLSMSSCEGQNKKKPVQKTTTVKNKTPHLIKKDTMEYYNKNEYKDWKIDPEHCSLFPCADNDKFIMKGDERINIFTDEKRFIQVERSSIINPYKIVKVYSFKNKQLLNLSKDFYSSPVSYEKYDEKGKIVEVKNYNEPYKFTIEDLIEKIKKEYKVDLGDKSEGSAAGRTSKDGVFYYEVFLRHKTGEQKMEYLLVDGTTGKTVLKSDFHVTP